MPPTFSPAKLLELTAREARKQRGNALFAARFQAKYGRAPSLAFLDFYDVEATTALDEKYLGGSEGQDKRVLVQIMGGEDDNGEPIFYEDYTQTHILVDPNLFESLAEVDRVYAQECAGTAPPTSSSSLCDAFPVESHDDDGKYNDLYTVRTVYTYTRPREDMPAWIREMSPVLDEAAIAAEMVKQDNELAAAATTNEN